MDGLIKEMDVIISCLVQSLSNGLVQNVQFVCILYDHYI